MSRDSGLPRGRWPQENRRPLSRGCRAARCLDLRLSFAQREQAGHGVTGTVPGRLDPRDLVAKGDQIARIETPRDRSRDAMTGLFALCERESQIKTSRGSTTAG